jgi:hypothetical protein
MERKQNESHAANCSHSFRSSFKSKPNNQYFYLEENIQTVKREIKMLKKKIENFDGKASDLQQKRKNKRRDRCCAGYYGIIIIMITVIIFMTALIIHKSSGANAEILLNNLLLLLFP